MTTQEQLVQLLGPIDIYLLDQVMKGNLQPPMRLLDAGCGHGRNLHYFLQAGYEVYACDHNPAYVQHVKAVFSQHNQPDLADDRVRLEAVESLSFDDHYFDWVFSSAVLHFAKDMAHFEAMMEAMWRVLKLNGILFIRMASDIGLEEKVVSLGNDQYHLPDGSDRFLLKEEMVANWLAAHPCRMVESLKTTNVQHMRCMTTWVLQKHSRQ